MTSIPKISASEILSKVGSTEITVKSDIAEILRAEARNTGCKIDFHDNGNGTVSLRAVDNSRNTNQDDRVDFTQKYHMPEFADKVRGLLKTALDLKRSCNILLTGLAGTGKTEFVYEIAREMGFGAVYQINGSEGLTANDFYGNLAVDVDLETRQNYTHFDKGVLYKAFIHGTELDDEGNQILYDDNGKVCKNGKPKVIGAPAVFFLDEFAAMLPEVFLGVFNRALEIPRNEGESRSIEIPMDNGRVVKSHPGMVVFLAGNTVGVGNSGKYQMSYTAQSNRMDESTLNRITATYHFHYNRSAEQEIALSILSDELESDSLMKLRDEMRKMFVNEQVERVMTTRTIRQVCELARSYRDAGIQDYMVEALRDNVFNQLPENDRPAWNQQINTIWNRDLMQEESSSNGYDVI